MNIQRVCNRSPSDESLPVCIYSSRHATAPFVHDGSILFFFSLVAAKLSAQHFTSQPPVKSPGEAGDGVVLLHLVFPFFVVFTGPCPTSDVVLLASLLSCSSFCCLTLTPCRGNAAFTNNAQANTSPLRNTHQMDLKIFLEVKPCSTQESLAVRLEQNQILTSDFFSPPHLPSDNSKKIKSLSVTLMPYVCFSARSENSRGRNNLFSTG